MGAQVTVCLLGTTELDYPLSRTFGSVNQGKPKPGEDTKQSRGSANWQLERSGGSKPDTGGTVGSGSQLRNPIALCACV